MRHGLTGLQSASESDVRSGLSYEFSDLRNMMLGSRRNTEPVVPKVKSIDVSPALDFCLVPVYSLHFEIRSEAASW
jgi:hypothetical protein